MTQSELDALPETGGIGYRTEVRDGVKVRLPVAIHPLALWQKADEPTTVTDYTGQRWLVGWAGGVEYKRRA